MKIAWPAKRLRAERGSAMVVIMVVLLVAVAGAAVYFFLLKRQNSGAGLVLAGQSPQSSVAVAALDRPEATLRDGIAAMNAGAAKDPKTKADWDKARQEFKDNTGIDLDDSASFTKAGFDLAKPITMAVLELDTKKTNPSGVVFSIAVSDGKEALETIKKAHEKSGGKVTESEGDPAVTQMEPETAMAVKDGRLYVAVVSMEGRAKLAESLREFFRRREASPLAADEGFKQSCSYLPTDGELSAFIDLRPLIQAMPRADASPALKELISLAMAAKGDTVSGYLSLRKEAELLKTAEAGGSCQDMLAKMDKPLGAITLSLANPVAFIKYVVKMSGDDKEVITINTQLTKLIGMDLDALEPLLKGGAVAWAIYPKLSLGGGIPVDVVALIKTNDRAKMSAALEKADWTGKPVKEAHGDNTLYISNTGKEAIGMIGDYFVVTNALGLARNLADGKSSANWKPEIGNKEFLGLEVSLGEIMKSYGPMLRMMGVEMNTDISADSGFALRASRKGDGFFFDILGKGLKTSDSLSGLLLTRSKSQAPTMPLRTPTPRKAPKP